MDFGTPNFSGTAAMASNQYQSSLPQYIQLALRAQQQQEEADYRNRALLQSSEEARMQDATNRMQIQQQGQLGLLASGSGSEEPSGPSYAEQLWMSRNGGNQNGGSPFSPEQLAYQAQSEQMAQGAPSPQSQYRPQRQPQEESVHDLLSKNMGRMLDEPKEFTKEKGLFMMGAKLAMDKVDTPEKAQILRNEILTEGAKKGYITKEEYDQASKVPLSQFRTIVDLNLAATNKLSEYKALSKLASGDDSKSGSGLSGPTKAKAEQDLMGADDNLKQLGELYKELPDRYFGASAYKQDVTNSREWASGLPLVGGLVSPSKEDKADLKAFSDKKSQADGLSLQIIKQLSGLSYTDKQLEYMKNVLPSIGSGTTRSQFEGKRDAAISWMKGIKQRRQELLSNGLELNSKEYQSQMRDYIDNTLPTLSNPSSNSPLRKHLLDKGYSNEEVDAALKARGL